MSTMVIALLALLGTSMFTALEVYLWRCGNPPSTTTESRTS